VDILGRSSLNDLILRVAGGRGHDIEENFVSKIKEYAEKVKVYEEPQYEQVEVRNPFEELIPPNPVPPLESIIVSLQEQLGVGNTSSISAPG
jgi:hypothetical protein